MKFVFNDGGKAATGHREVNDCACRAIAIATGHPYHEIWDMFKTLLEAESVRPRSGVNEIVQHKVMESLGWTWVEARKAYLVEHDLPSGRLVVCIRGHSLAVIDRVIHDTFNPSFEKTGMLPPIYGYYKNGQKQSRHGLDDDQEKMYDLVITIIRLADKTDGKGEREAAKAKAA
jgi:hypothetical protein